MRDTGSNYWIQGGGRVVQAEGPHVQRPCGGLERSEGQCGGNLEGASSIWTAQGPLGGAWELRS